MTDAPAPEAPKPSWLTRLRHELFHPHLDGTKNVVAQLLEKVHELEQKVEELHAVKDKPAGARETAPDEAQKAAGAP